MQSQLRTVRRYAEERNAQKEKLELTTPEEVKAAYGRLKETRRAFEKVKAKNLLTERDQMQVGRLLKGEILPEDLAETDNKKGILAVFEAKKPYEESVELIRDWNKRRKAALLEKADGYLQNASNWKDKKMGIQYSRETMERNMRDIIKDPKEAEAVIREYFEPVHKAAADANRLKERMRERVRGLKLGTKETKAMLEKGMVSEAHAVQLIGEAMDNIEYLEKSGRYTRDGKTLQEWKTIVNNLWINNPQLDRAKIENAVQEFRSIYDELFAEMNESRLRNGYEPVNYRKGYFPHFQKESDEGVLGKFGKSMGIEMDVTALPTTINGLTHTFKPGIQWMGNALERIGFETAYDAVQGFDKYIESVADVIYQTDNIQKLRALASQIRYRASTEGIKAEVDELRRREDLRESERETLINEKYAKGKYELAHLVGELDEYTNLLANKKSRADRNMEQALGRQMYTTMKKLESRVAANMVAINPPSWLTNFIPLAQGGSELSTRDLLKGMGQTLQAMKNADGIDEASNFLTNRRGSEALVRDWSEKASAAMSKPMELIDQFTAGSLVRGRVEQNLRRGLSQELALEEADAWAASVMADRSKGSMPTLFNRTDPLTKLFTQFQLEVNNDLSHLFKDIPRNQRDKGAAALAKTLLKFFVGTWLYNEVYEFFIGRRPALDPIGILNDSVGDLTGYELPNLVEMGIGAVKGKKPDFATEKAGTYAALSDAGSSVAESLPFIGGLLGGGRLPIGSAIPDAKKMLETSLSEKKDPKKKWATVGKELGKPATYLALPFGGGQIKKIYEGLDAAARGGSYTVDNEGNDILQYPMYMDSTMDKAKSVAGSLLFGKTATEGGRQWVESGFENLSAKETAVYQGMTEIGVKDRDAYGLLQELGKIPSDDKKAKRDALRRSEVDGAGKSVLFYGMMASDKDKNAMNALEAENPGIVVETLLDMKDMEKAVDQKYVIVKSGLSDEGKLEMLKYYAEGDHIRYKTAYDNGVALDTYLEFQALRPQYHEGSGSITQEETKELLDSMDVSKEQKAIIWQTGGKNWAPKNNPYSTKIGEKIYKIMNESGDETMKVYLPRPGEVMQTMLPKV